MWSARPSMNYRLHYIRAPESCYGFLNVFFVIPGMNHSGFWFIEGLLFELFGVFRVYSSQIPSLLCSFFTVFAILRQ